MTDTTSAAQSERELFEAHMRSLNPCVMLARQREVLGGYYRTMTVQRAWELWQAARRTQPGARKQLTDEQIDAINVRTLGHRHFAREIERAHGIT